MAGGKHILGKAKRHIFGTARVGEKGQIVIPKEARQIFGVQPGDTLLILGDAESGIIVSKPLVDLLAVDLVMEIVCLFCSEAMPLRCMELLLDVHLIHSIIGTSGFTACFCSSTGFFLPYNLCNILRH